MNCVVTVVIAQRCLFVQIGKVNRWLGKHRGEGAVGDETENKGYCNENGGTNNLPGGASDLGEIDVEKGRPNHPNEREVA